MPGGMSTWRMAFPLMRSNAEIQIYLFTTIPLLNNTLRFLFGAHA